MRLLLLFSSIFILHFNIGHTQNTDFRLGFEISPTLSWLSSDVKKIQSDGSNLGLQIVMNGEYYFRPNYALKSGLGISFRNGGQLKFEDGGIVLPDSELSNEDLRMLPANGTVRYKVQYVEIPFGFKMRTNEIGMFRYFAELPVFTLGLCMQSRGDIGLSGGENENIAKDTRWMNFSWGLGGGAEYAISSTTSLIAGIFFQQGVTDILSKNDANPAKAELNRLSFRLGMMF